MDGNSSGDAVIGEVVPVTNFDVEPIESRGFSHDQVHEALTVLAVSGGSPTKAASVLKEQGLTVGKDSLSRWRDHYPNRYRDICARLVPRIEDGLVDRYRHVAVSAAEGAHEAVELERARIAAGDVKDAGKTAQQLALASAIGTDKMLTLTGRPDRIVATPDAAATLRGIAARFAGLVIEGTAEEVLRGQSGREPTIGRD